MPLTIIFLGKSGSGKGTQAIFLRDRLGFRVIEMGELLRSFIKRGTPFSGRVQGILSAGNLAPSWLVVYLWMHELMQIKAESSVVFDGSCRLVEEARMLDEVLDMLGRAPSKILLLEISEEEAVRRLLARRICEACKTMYQGDALETQKGICTCGGKLVKRHDDEPDIIRNRLAFFEKDVSRVIAHYEVKGWLIHINGEQPAEKVHQDILQSLKQVTE